MRATHWRWAAAVLASTLISSVGCGPPKEFKRLITALEDNVELLKSVTDASSAQAAIPKIKPAFAELSASSVAMNPEKLLGNLSDLEKLAKVMEQIAALMEQHDAETERIDGLTGLPQEFWNEYRIESCRQDVDTLKAMMGDDAMAFDPSDDDGYFTSMQQLLSMYEQYGGGKVVMFELTNVTEENRNAAIERLREAAGGTAIQLVAMDSDDEYDVVEVTVAPIEDYDALIAAVDFAKVTKHEKARGEATVELPATVEHDPLAAVAAAPPVQETPPAAEPVTPPVETPPVETPPVVEPPVESVVVDSGGAPTGVNPDSGYPPGYDPAYGREGGYPANPDSGVPAGYEDRGGVPPNPDSGYPPGYADPSGRPPLDDASAVAADVPGDAPAAAPSPLTQIIGALLGGGAPAGPPLPPGAPNPADPNYHAQLAELLHNPQSEFHEAAVLALLEVKPADVTDKAVRERIAKGYKFVAFESGGHTAEGVRGLVAWGGKYSVPLLVQLLDPQAAATAAGGEAGRVDGGLDSGGDSGLAGGREDVGRGGEYGGAEFAPPMAPMGGVPLTPEVEAVIYAALGELATPEAAAAVVARLETAASTGGEAIVASLRQMGPVAEAALIKVLPFESSTEGNLLAIDVLGDVGTKKSLAIIRLATQSENEQIVEAALEARRKIQERLRAEREQEQAAEAAAAPG